MQTITTSDIWHLADLSGLELQESEVSQLQADLEGILALTQQLSELDTNGVEPTYQVTGLNNVWRGDDVDQPLDRDALLSLAPEQQDHQIRVPQVL